MLAPAQDYKDILLSKMHNFDKIALVFGTREIKLYFDKDTYYYYVSLSSSKEIVGIFGY
jgi:hypothetical protein